MDKLIQLGGQQVLWKAEMKDHSLGVRKHDHSNNVKVFMNWISVALILIHNLCIITSK